MTREEKVLDALEYNSLLLSMMLAKEFNQDKPNRAMAVTAKKVSDRCQSNRIKLVCANAAKLNPLTGVTPDSWLQKQFRKIKSMGHLSVDEFIKTGIKL